MSYTNEEILERLAISGEEKARRTITEDLILGFVSGFLAALGYIIYIQFVSLIPDSYALKGILDVFIHPIGPLLVFLGGSDIIVTLMFYIITDINMKIIKPFQGFGLAIIILISNVIGTIVSSYIFGHLGGFMETTEVISPVVLASQKTIDLSWTNLFVAGLAYAVIYLIGIWCVISTDHKGAKILYVWFFVVLYYVLGSKNPLISLTLLASAYFSGQTTLTIASISSSFLIILLGSLVGGVLFIILPFNIAYKKHTETSNYPV